MKFFLAAALFALVGCGGVQQDQEPKKDGNSAMVNETDYTACANTSPAPVSPVGTWKAVFSRGNFHFTKFYRISNDSLLITHNCDFDGNKVSATAASSISMTYGQITVLSNNHNEQSVTKEGYLLTCQSLVTAGMMNYQFQGRCLVLTDTSGGGQMMLAPVN